MTVILSQQPLVTILFLAYQQEQWVRASAEGCLAQIGGPYEIILSDDHSTDRTFDILQEVAAQYHGLHQVIVRRSPVNLGIGQHYNDLIKLARGELLVTMAADDFSTPDRVECQVSAWEATGRHADLIACHVIDMDSTGKLHDVIRVDDLGCWASLSEWVAQRPYIIGATHAFTKRMMMRFKPFDTQVFYEDQIMVFRAIAGGGAVTLDAPLVHYRRGGTSMRPTFKTDEEFTRWTRRQRRRELAEMHQLMDDARCLGCSEMMGHYLGLSFYWANYLNELSEATTDEQRWQLARNARKLPWWWRMRKALHLIYPRQTLAVKKFLSFFHRRRSP